MATVALSEVVLFSENQDSPVTMTIYAPTGVDLAIQRLTPSEAAEYGEEPIQILEGLRYEYELSDPNYRLMEESGIGIVCTSSNPNLAHCGTLVTGLYTGKLTLHILDVLGGMHGTAALEIRPRKLGHRDHYRQMLEDITDVCVGLAMELRAPTSMKVAPSPGNSFSTIHQRFSFLRALISSQTFRDALHRISTHPHRRWEAEERIIDVCRGFRANAKTMREIAKAPRRVPVHADHPLSAVISSVPERIPTYRSAQTDDTKENRFVKFVLETFVAFLKSMQRKLDELALEKVRRGVKNSEGDLRLQMQIAALENQLVHSLNADIFRNQSQLDTLPFGSSVLQRKEGYREIYQSWLKFDMAVRLAWAGGEDVYGAGQRDIATLYEYWVFFKLLSIVSDYFKLTSPMAETLLEQTEDGFGLKLKSGEHLAFDATRIIAGRSLNVQFGYNRSFRKNTKRSLEGSWTERMRPDYTLSLWPSDFSAAEAEGQEMMAHIHFDAKYRIDDLQEIFGKENRLSQDDEVESPKGKYKRDDLLKMHAYRDAIRRTQGAYVIYPGEAQKGWEEFNEILPGLGAFALRPGGGEAVLTKFINDVVLHVCDRATQRERSTFHQYQIHKNELSTEIHIPLPELDPGTRERIPPPAETIVFMAFTASMEQYRWTLKNGIYAFPASKVGEVESRIERGVFAARYVLISSPGLFPFSSLSKVVGSEARLLTARMLEQMGCPDVIEGLLYIVFEIEEDSIFSKCEWEVDAAKMPYVLTLDLVINECLRR